MPISGIGPTFTVTFNAAGTYSVTVTDAAKNTDMCSVTVEAAPTSTPTTTPTATPTATPTTTPTATPTATPTSPFLSIQKTVQNITQNGSEVENTNANPSDTVQFIARVTSNGGASAIQIVARDSLPAGLSYQGGSTTVDSAPAADGIVGTGLNLGDMAPGRTITIMFRATVAPDSYFLPGTTVLTNMAYARGSNVPEVSDPAFVTVSRIVANASMALTKLGRNVSRGDTAQTSPVYAEPSQTIEFDVHVRNTSTTVLTGLVVRDVLPQGVTFVPGTVKVNGQTFPGGDALVTVGIGPGPLAAGQEVVVSFLGTVAPAAELPAGLTTLINVAQANADNIPQLIAQLPIIIGVPTPAVPPIETGPGESALLALIISAIITLLYVGYTSTDVFRRREVEGLAQKAKHDRSMFDFRR
jgi:uncharacterized repeat protein (TIGR01451 family)